MTATMTGEPQAQLQAALADLFATVEQSIGSMRDERNRDLQERLARLKDLTLSLLAFVEGGSRKGPEGDNP